VVNDDARVVQLLMRLYSTGRHSYTQLAMDLNRQGYRFRARNGTKPFSKESMRGVLKNTRLYAGQLPVGRQTQGTYPEIYDGEHEPIIDEDLAARVEEVRRKRTKGSSRGPSRVYLLTGIGYCHECGARLWGRRRGERDATTYRHSGPACQPWRGSFDAEDLETQAVALLNGLALPTQLQDMVTEQVKKQIETEPRNTEILAMLKTKRARLMRLKEMRLEGEVDREEYLKRKAEITAHIEHLESQLGPGSYEPDTALQRVTDLGRLVAECSPSQRRAGLRSVFERLEVSVQSGEIVKVVPKPWFRVFFGDLVEEWE